MSGTCVYIYTYTIGTMCQYTIQNQLIRTGLTPVRTDILNLGYKEKEENQTKFEAPLNSYQLLRTLVNNDGII